MTHQLWFPSDRTSSSERRRCRFHAFIFYVGLNGAGRRISAAPRGLEPSVACFKGIVFSRSQHAAKLRCSIFKQTTQEMKKREMTRCPALTPTPPPGEDCVQKPGNPERAEGALAAAHPGDVTFPSPGSSLSMPSSIRSVS